MIPIMDMVLFNPSIGIRDNSIAAWPGICTAFAAATACSWCRSGASTSSSASPRRSGTRVARRSALRDARGLARPPRRRDPPRGGGVGARAHEARGVARARRAGHRRGPEQRRRGPAPRPARARARHGARGAAARRRRRRSTWPAIRSSCRAAPSPPARRWPRLGEHTDEILARDLGARRGASAPRCAQAGVIG